MMDVSRTRREDAMTGPLWWQRGVVYQIYPRSYLDTDSDGVGNIRGIAEKVEYLHRVLGVDAVWLSPFYPSPMADFGYDVSNYTDVHPVFGTLADFDELVAALHARDMHIIIDYTQWT
jgi:alpha-glucosidase